MKRREWWQNESLNFRDLESAKMTNFVKDIQIDWRINYISSCSGYGCSGVLLYIILTISDMFSQYISKSSLSPKVELNIFFIFWCFNAVLSLPKSPHVHAKRALIQKRKGNMLHIWHFKWMNRSKMVVQCNLSYPTHWGTRQKCRIKQGVRILRFFLKG